jgi:hypothetical protein
VAEFGAGIWIFLMLLSNIIVLLLILGFKEDVPLINELRPLPPLPMECPEPIPLDPPPLMESIGTLSLIFYVRPFVLLGLLPDDRNYVFEPVVEAELNDGSFIRELL